MTFDPQDPQWTAYVLGELDGAEWAVVEQRLETSPTLRQFVAELRKTLDQVNAAIQAEPSAQMTAEQRERVLTEIVKPELAQPVEFDGKRSRNTRPSRRRRLAFLALAASLLVALMVGGRSYLLHRDGNPSEPALNGRFLASGASSVATDIETFDVSGAPMDPTELSTDTLSFSRPTPGEGPNPIPPTEAFEEAGGGQAASTTAQGLGGVDLKAIGAGAALKRRESTAGAEQEKGAQAPVATGSCSSLPEPIRARAKDIYGAREPVPSRPTNQAKKRARLGETVATSAPPLLPVARHPLPDAPTDAVNHPTGFGGTGSHTRHADPRALAEEGPAAEVVTLAAKPTAGQIDAEDYTSVADNPFLTAVDNPLSTFSVDIDTAAYANLRRFLLQNRQLPPPAAVRIEELINYFHYDYPQPAENVPFAVVTEVAGCPWNGEHRLLRIGIKGRDLAAESRPASNLVFLIDVSGSMNQPNKLPLVKEALRLLVGQLRENDRVAVVVYAGSSGLVLPSTTGDQRDVILAAIDHLSAGGSTNGGQGIQLAYDIAAVNFIKAGTNRVILATDGDFNVGITDHGSLVKLIEEKAKTGVFLTTLGFGMGNLKDSTLEQLADKGNGNYAYIDGIREARKVFVEQMTGTLVTIAKDVKLQLEFNPAQVGSYRLIGYENRVLRHEDFNNDKKDAGDIGAGHTVTALFELVPAGMPIAAGVDPLKYQKPTNLTEAAKTGELVTLKLRYKQPDGDKSQLIEHPVTDGGKGYAQASADFKFASAVALFGMLLRESPYHGTATFDAVQELAQEGRGSDLAGYRAEFLQLVAAAKQLRANK
jgi:Ca-activated chloride channel family protein